MKRDEETARLTIELARALFDDGPDRNERRRRAAMAIEAAAPGVLGQMQATIDLARMRRRWQSQTVQ